MTLVQEEPRGPSELIEVPVTANGLSRVNLPDVQQLRSTVEETVVLKALRLITPKVLSNGPITGRVTATLAESVKISLVIYCEGWEKGHLIPLLTLNDNFDSDATAATTIPFRAKTTRFDDWKNVDWAKSFLQFSNGTVSANTPYVVLLEAEYVKYNSKGKRIEV